VIKNLLDEQARLFVYDPQTTEEDMFNELDYTHGVNEKTHPDLKKLVKMVPDVMEACDGSHALAIMTEWDCFKTLDYEAIYKKMAKPAFVFDGRNILDHDGLRRIGYDVDAIGKPQAGAMPGRKKDRTPSFSK